MSMPSLMRMLEIAVKAWCEDGLDLAKWTAAFDGNEGGAS